MTTEMANAVEFITIRQRIELLAKQIDSTTEEKAVAESSHRLDEASKLLVTLTAMASNDRQETAIERLTRQLAGLGTKVGALAGKKRIPQNKLLENTLGRIKICREDIVAKIKKAGYKVKM
jgi:hypothetical protein